MNRPSSTVFYFCMSGALLAFLACIATPVHAVTFTWDQNGAVAGSGGTGAWDTTSSFWNNGAVTTWVDGAGNDAVFPNTAGTVTISAGETRTAGFITFSNAAGNYNIAGGDANSRLNLTNASASIVMQTNTASTNGQAINANISGTDITVANNYSGAVNGSARTLLNINGPTSFTGSLILGGTGAGTALNNANQVALGNANSLGGPANTSTVKFARNFSNLLFTSGGAGGAAAYTASYANDIDLNATGSTGAAGFTSAIGSATSGTVITLNGVIKGTGDANLIFTNGLSGGQGKIIIANNATYSGTTGMTMASTATTSGVIALGTNNALPTGTTLTLGNASNAPSGTFDTAGFNQRLAGLATAGTGFLGGITNTTGTMSTITISGNVVSTFGVASGGNTGAANIGVTQFTTTPAALANNSNNIALVLDSQNTGKLTLARPAGNTYSGGTTISGGTLVAANTSGSATGSGAVTINNGGTLAGTGAVAGPVAVNSGGTLAPGASIESLDIGANLSFAAGGKLEYEINSVAALAAAADLVNVSGNLSIAAGALLAISDAENAALPAGTKFTLISYTGSWDGGIFDTHPDNSVLTVGLNEYLLDYNDTVAGVNFGGGPPSISYVTLTVSAVPEPTAFLFGGLASLMIAAAHSGRRIIARNAAARAFDPSI